MCGLVGIAGDLSFKDELAMKRLFLSDYFRGPDSTGLAAIRTNGDVRIVKAATGPLDLFDHCKFKETLNGLTSTAFIGHNRSATRGAVNNVNAHPYQYSHITGVHNGTLDYKSTKSLEDALGDKYATDSMALFAAIAKFGVEEAVSLVEEGRDSSTGAWSLVWHDAIEGSLNFLRNKHRPMWYAYSKDFKRLFWASEWPMIQFVTKISGFELYAEEKTGYQFWSTDEDVHLKFDLTLLKEGGDKRPKPKAKTIKGKEPAPAYVAPQADPFQRGGFTSTVNGVTTTHTHGKKTNTTLTTTYRLPSKEPTHIHLFGTKEHPLAGFYDKEAFDQIAKYGCAWCQDDVHYGDVGLTIFDNEKMVLCGKAGCSGTDGDDVTTPTSRIYVRQETLESLK